MCLSLRARMRLVVDRGEDQADRLAARDDVHYLGPLPAEKLARVYRACDVFALPTSNEGFPLTVQEAMSSGLPVLTTGDPAYASYELDPDRIALIDRDVAQVRDGLRRIARDAGLRTAMGAYSREYADKHFAWSEHIATLLACYRSTG